VAAGRVSRVLIVALVLLIALPPLAVVPTGSMTTETASVPAAAAQRADKKGRRDARPHKKERRNQNKKNNTQDARPPVRTPPIDPKAKDRSRRGRSDTQQGPTKRERARLWRQMCDAPGSIRLPKSQECTHGPDPAPPGVDITRSAPPLSPAAARRAQARLECDGDGQSGPRVQVLYAHAANVASRFAAYHASFQAWTADADTILQESAAEAGGSRRFRFVTTAACAIDVQKVKLSTTGDDSFDNTITELKTQGFNRTDRKYLIFVDTTAAGICGIANLWPDDDPRQMNWNNYGPGYARVDAGCWGEPPFGGGWTAAHELMHNLGGVQHSAPHTSRGGHCIDDYDVMCYSDTPYFPAMRIDCSSFAHESRFDCGHDDYFHPSPPAGTYLATHWNAANNRFIVGGGNGPDDAARATVSWTAPVGNGKTYRTSGGTVALKATASDDAGINRVEFWRFHDPTDKWILFSTDRSAPYGATLDVSQLPLGYNQVNVVAYDGIIWEWSTRYIWVERVKPAAPVITAPKAGAKLKPGATIAVTVSAPDAARPAIVEVRVCPGTSCRWSFATSLGKDTSAPFARAWQVPKKGTFTLLARITDASGTRTSKPVTVSVQSARQG
jgi:hypothetical protein